MTTAQDMIKAGKADPEEALAVFDALQPADTDFMLGRWKGAELHTGNAMDGLLAATGWYGKEFVDADRVHPLVFSGRTGQLLRLEPRKLFAGMALANVAARLPVITRVFRLMLPLLKTRRSRARLRMTEYRGKVSATMIYDNLPINDVFRKVDDNTVLGVMDLKGLKQPYFFILHRDT